MVVGMVVSLGINTWFATGLIVASGIHMKMYPMACSSISIMSRPALVVVERWLSMR